MSCKILQCYGHVTRRNEERMGEKKLGKVEERGRHRGRPEMGWEIAGGDILKEGISRRDMIVC